MVTYRKININVIGLYTYNLYSVSLNCMKTLRYSYLFYYTLGANHGSYFALHLPESSIFPSSFPILSFFVFLDPEVLK